MVNSIGHGMVRRSSIAAGFSTAMLVAIVFLVCVSSVAVASPPRTVVGPERGSGAGQVSSAGEVAVGSDPSSLSYGDVYVADGGNDRIDVLEPPRVEPPAPFLRAFGWGVADGVTDALQTCTTTCFAGLHGSGPGVSLGEGIAVDPSTGDVYEAQGPLHRVQKFSPDGGFELMFGKEVNKTKVKDHGSEAEEGLCTKADVEAGDVCEEGTKGTGPREFSNGPYASFPVAVDPSGDVWVGGDDRVQEFTPGGAFVKEVELHEAGIAGALAIDTSSSASSGDLYFINHPVDEEQLFTRPTSGAYTLTFEGQTTKSMPFDEPTGSSNCPGSEPQCTTVSSELEKLSTMGAGNVSVGLNGEGKITIVFTGALSGTAVPLVESSAGSIVVGKEGVPGRLRKFSPSGGLLGTLDESGHPDAVSVDPATGNVFVSDLVEPAATSSSGKATLLEYGPSGAELEAFGSGKVLGGPQGNALAFDDENGRLYVANGKFDTEPEESAVQEFALPAAGPLPAEGSVRAEPVGKTTATLGATINPEGVSTKYMFEYVTEAQFKANGYTDAQKTPESASIGSDFSEHSVSAVVTGLALETTYHVRVVAKNGNGVNYEEGAPFTTLPPLRVDATYASEAASTSVTLDAQVNPLGEAASYRFEYLSEAAYSKNIEEGLEPFSGAQRSPSEEQGDAPIAGSQEDEYVSQHLEGLSPQTAYRYRVFVFDPVDPAGRLGGEQAFTTQGAGGSLVLPDDRAWEMVSPVEKNGGGIEGIHGALNTPVVQAAADGESITFASAVAFAGEISSPHANQYLATRGPDGGWSTQGINIPTNSDLYAGFADPPYQAFSTDLSMGLISTGYGPPNNAPIEPLSGTEAAPGNGNLYLRDNLTGGLRAVLTEEDLSEAGLPLDFNDATPNLQHIVFAEQKTNKQNAPYFNLYEWSNGRLSPVSILPGHTRPTPEGNNGAGDGEPDPFSGTSDLNDPRAISGDGSRVVWAVGDIEESGHSLYLRENVGEEQGAFGPGGECPAPVESGSGACTVQVDKSRGGSGKGGEGQFLAASVDDSKIFFTDPQKLTSNSTASGIARGCLNAGNRSCTAGDLYLFEPEGENGSPKLTDLTIDHADPNGAEVLGVLGASEDGSYVYFVAQGVLATNVGVHGETALPGDCRSVNEKGSRLYLGVCNLYLEHEGHMTFIASLSSADDEGQAAYEELPGGTAPSDWPYKTAVRTVRVSPDGHDLVFMSRRSLTGYDNIDVNNSYCGKNEFEEPYPAACPEVYMYEAPSGEQSSAGQVKCLSCNPTGERPLGPSGIPGGSWYGHQGGIYQSRVLSADDDRVFFDSYDSLVPQDTNGKMDVYEWEAVGHGTCESSSETYSAASGGCVSLISSGTSNEDSEFVDASETGSDVFFLTGQSLVKKDPGSIDLYDAREDGGEPAEAPPPALCEANTCQSPPAAPLVQTPASLTFVGQGNPSTPMSVTSVKVTSKKAIKCAKGKKLSHGRCVKSKPKKRAKTRKATTGRGRGGR